MAERSVDKNVERNVERGVESKVGLTSAGEELLLERKVGSRRNRYEYYET